MSNKPHPYFHRQPRTVHVFNPRQSPSRSISNRSNSPTRILHPIQNRIITRPPSRYSNLSDDSRSNNSVSRSHSFLFELDTSGIRKKQLNQMEKLREDLSKALRRIKQLEQRQLEGVLIKNQNINLRSQLMNIKTQAKSFDQPNNKQILSIVQYHTIKLQQQNIKLKEELHQSLVINKNLLVDLERLNLILKEQRINYEAVSNKCHKLQMLTKQLEQQIQQMESFIQPTEFQMKQEGKEGRQIMTINKYAYTNMYD